MIKKDLFKSIIEQNSPDKNEILTNILTNPVTNKNPFNFKRIVKYALPAIMVFAIIFIQIFYVPVLTNQQQSLKSNNRFSLVAYAADLTSEDIIQSEIIKDIKVKLPSLRMIEESGLKVGYAYYDTAGFKIEGENIKSVYFESKNGILHTIPLILPSPKPNPELANELEITAYFEIPGTIILDGEDILNLMVMWIPYKYQEAFRLGEDYQEFLTDTITITVAFNDGEEMTQIAEITIDDDSGDVYAELRDK